MDEKLEGKVAFRYILRSTLVVWASIGVLFCVIHFLQSRRQADECYMITTIVSRSHTSDIVAPSVFAEFLDLSCDAPTNLYTFSPRGALSRLKALDAFSRVKVRRVRPGIVIIDYTLRTPLAKLADYENRAIDATGAHIFPLYPFFSPKKLPELYLGSSEPERLKLALEVLGKAGEAICWPFRIKALDVSGRFAGGANREIILSVEEEKSQGAKTYVLRLDGKDWQDGLERFFALTPTLDSLPKNGDDVAAPSVIDLRVARIALFR